MKKICLIVCLLCLGGSLYGLEVKEPPKKEPAKVEKQEESWWNRLRDTFGYGAKPVVEEKIEGEKEPEQEDEEPPGLEDVPEEVEPTKEEKVEEQEETWWGKFKGTFGYGKEPKVKEKKKKVYLPYDVMGLILSYLSPEEVKAIAAKSKKFRKALEGAGYEYKQKKIPVRFPPHVFFKKSFIVSRVLKLLKHETDLKERAKFFSMLLQRKAPVIDCSNTNIDPEQLKLILNHFDYIGHLNVSGCQNLGKKGMEYIRKFASYKGKSIETLDISGINRCEDSWLEGFDKASSIKNIIAKHLGKVTHVGIGHLNTNLEQLNVMGYVRQYRLENIERFTKLAHLETSWQKGMGRDVEERLPVTLKHLTIQENRHYKGERIDRLINLETLNVSECSDISVLPLNAPNLKRLDICWTKLNIDFLRALAQTKVRKSLEELHCSMDGEGLYEIISWFSNLKKLSCRAPADNDQASPLKKLTKLRDVSMWDVSDKLTSLDFLPEALEALKLDGKFKSFKLSLERFNVLKMLEIARFTAVPVGFFEGVSSLLVTLRMDNSYFDTDESFSLKALCRFHKLKDLSLYIRRDGSAAIDLTPESIKCLSDFPLERLFLMGNHRRPSKFPEESVQYLPKTLRHIDFSLGIGVKDEVTKKIITRLKDKKEEVYMQYRTPYGNYKKNSFGYGFETFE